MKNCIAAMLLTFLIDKNDYAIQDASVKNDRYTVLGVVFMMLYVNPACKHNDMLTVADILSGFDLRSNAPLYLVFRQMQAQLGFVCL